MKVIHASLIKIAVIVLLLFAIAILVVVTANAIGPSKNRNDRIRTGIVQWLKSSATKIWETVLTGMVTVIGAGGLTLLFPEMVDGVTKRLPNLFRTASHIIPSVLGGRGESQESQQVYPDYFATPVLTPTTSQQKQAWQ
jgi:hypothetical protein